MQNWKVIVIARNETKLKLLQKELWANFNYFIWDIRNAEQLEKIFHKIHNINCLINNSAVWYRKETKIESLMEIEDTIMTNLVGAIRCTRLALPNMIQNKDWVIINIGSMLAIQGKNWASTYSASKAGLKMYTDVLREEVKKDNIKVINIHPWKIETPMRGIAELEAFQWRMLQPEALAAIIYDSYEKAIQWMVQEEICIKPQWIIK